LLVLVEVVEHGLSPVYDFSRQTISRSRKAGDRTMPEKIIQVNQPMFETELDRMVSEKVTEILNRMLDAEADEITGAARYERSDGRKAYRAGHYERDLTVKAGKLSVRVPKLKGALFESAVIERYRRREESVEEALIDMYLAGVSTRRVDDISQALWGGGCRRRPCQTSSRRCMRVSTSGVNARYPSPTRMCSWMACGTSVRGVAPWRT
jgi:hypothetical protein